MKLIKYFILIACFFILSSCKDSQQNIINIKGDGVATTLEQDNKHVSNEYIIVTVDSIKPDAIKNIFKEFGIKSVVSFSKDKYLIRIENDPGIDKMKEISKNHTEIKYIQYNYIYKQQ